MNPARSEIQQPQGVRDICDLDFASSRALDGNVAASEVLRPGDIVFCKTSKRWISRKIAKLDGYWSHSALYVGVIGGVPSVAHAQAPGIVIEPLDEVSGRYRDGVAFGRPFAADPALGQAAAKWAIELEGDAESQTMYSGMDLGEAYMILRRADRAVVERLMAAEEQLESFGRKRNDEPFKSFESTCSGFVYRCYSEGARTHPPIVTSPGIELRDGCLYVLGDSRLLDDADQASDAQEGIGKSVLGYLRMARKLAQAGRGMLASLSDNSIAVERGVTPNDLWMGTDKSSRIFLNRSYWLAAIEESDGCSAASLVGALEHDGPRLASAITTVGHDLATGASSNEQGHAVFRRLHAARKWSELIHLYEAFLSREEPVSDEVTKRYAQALIETGALTAAQGVVDSLIAEAGPVERAEARGLRGRIAKQRHINYGAASALVTAIQAYQVALDAADGAEQFWPGANLVALLARAQRLGVDADDPTPVAEGLLASLKDIPADKRTFFEAATAVECYLAVGNEHEAALIAHEIASAPGASEFELESFRRQLRQVWELTIESAVYRAAADSSLRNANDVVIDVPPGVELQALISAADVVPYTTYLQGLTAARAVCMMTNRAGNPKGSGFVINGQLLHHRLPDQPVVVTCAHVVSSEAVGELRPESARAVFEAVPSGNGSLKLRELTELWTSAEIDVTILLAASSPELDDACLSEVAAGAPSLDDDDSYVYIIGHPTGQHLSLSIRGNDLVAVNEEQVHYLSPTEAGNSGGPAFDCAWDLIGVHRAGSEFMPRLDDPQQTYAANAAVAVPALRRALDHATFLWEQSPKAVSAL